MKAKRIPEITRKLKSMRDMHMIAFPPHVATLVLAVVTVNLNLNVRLFLFGTAAVNINLSTYPPVPKAAQLKRSCGAKEAISTSHNRLVNPHKTAGFVRLNLS